MSGSVDGYVYEVMRETEPDLDRPDEGRPASRSSWAFPPSPARPAAADDPRIKKLQAALVGMAGHPDGRAVLRLLRLDGFSVEDPSLFDTIAAEVAIVRGGAG